MELPTHHLQWRDRSRRWWADNALRQGVDIAKVASWEIHSGIRPVMDVLIQLDTFEESHLTVDELAGGFAQQRNVHEQVLELWARDLVAVTAGHIAVTQFGKAVHSELNATN